MSTYNIVIESNESTLVTEYTPEKRRSDAYQSEADLEHCFIKMLCDQGYEYLKIKDSKALEDNLRVQLEKLNDIKFSNNEWQNLFTNVIANKNDSILEKTRTIQEDPTKVITLDNGSSFNVKLIDKSNIHKNSLQVINQYVVDSGKYQNRYDVTVLVNGLPLVHIELKRRGVAIKEAFNQINRYQRDSFWADSGLFEYIQIFVISNGTNTKYYSNTTRNEHIKTNIGKSTIKTSNSFEFTSFWADFHNHVLFDLVDFTKTFFARHTILNILTKYCIFTSDNNLLVMRPYQIAATEAILQRINIANNYKKMGSISAGGYIWHTTGSGKTLTSFKSAQLASKLDFIDKVLFVVDRKDLDYQTIKEYDKFQKGAANSNKDTKTLIKQLNDVECKIIVTTIQKLTVFISQYKSHPIYTKNVVIIFDECHRSQFGLMHQNIIKNFKNYYIFGFTGTPIFSVNSNLSGIPSLKTTEQAFGDKLHTYTIVDAINDKNVLPFRIDYISTIRKKDAEADTKVEAIDTDAVLNSKERVHNICEYILKHFDQKTLRNKNYSLKGRRVSGFNAMFAVSSIDMCKRYYEELKKQIISKNIDLKIATIFSFAPNEDVSDDGFLGEEEFETDHLNQSSRDFLQGAIEDYNNIFKTNFDTSSDKFQNYYKDLSMRIKNREVDLVIVVNMFLTGFDATTLNTLWVDKNLKMHGLIQAYSRTNRILNAVKSYGNIVCFRNLEKATNDAIGLFGDRDACGVVLLKSYDDYYNGYSDENGHEFEGYITLITKLQTMFPLGKAIISESKEIAFISLFGSILRVRNILSSFDEFAGHEILSTIDFQDYTGLYHDIHDKYKGRDKHKESILDDVVFEMDLVKQVEVNIDFILDLAASYHDSNCKDKEKLIAISKAVNSSEDLRSKKDLINRFLKRIDSNSDVDININNTWKDFVQEAFIDDLNNIITTESLNEDKTNRFIQKSFRDGEIKTSGTDIDDLMPKMSLFAKNNGRQAKKDEITEQLQIFFNKFYGVYDKYNAEL